MFEVKSNDNFDFTVTDIDFVRIRRTNGKWLKRNIKNDNKYLLIFALEGKAKYIFDDTEFNIKKGDLLFIKKGVSHTAYSDKNEPWSYCTIAFDIIAFDGESVKNTQCLPDFIGIKYTTEFNRRVNELFDAWITKKVGYKVKCRGILCDLLYMLIQDAVVNDSNLAYAKEIEEVKSYILKNYEKRFTVKELADMIGISQSYFRTLFKKYTGYTAIQYQNIIKIDIACTMLKSSEFNVTEAAYATGFNNVYYFSKMFKKITGVNPTSY